MGGMGGGFPGAGGARRRAPLVPQKVEVSHLPACPPSCPPDGWLQKSWFGAREACAAAIPIPIPITTWLLLLNEVFACLPRVRGACARRCRWC